MLSELFQLDEPLEEDGEESLRGGGSEDSYSEEDEDLTEDSDENGSYANCSRPQDDSKAVAVIRSVGELSVPEKYKSTHLIRVSASLQTFFSPVHHLRGIVWSTPINILFKKKSVISAAKLCFSNITRQGGKMQTRPELCTKGEIKHNSNNMLCPKKPLRYCINYVMLHCTGVEGSGWQH